MSESQEEFVYDLFSEMRKRPQRMSAIVAAMRRVDMVSRAFAEGKALRQDIVQAEADLLPACGFNFGLLIPKFFPRYPFDSPLDFSSRPFMFAMTATAPGSIITFKAGRQVGKCADGDSEVMTNHGKQTLRGLFDKGRPV